MKFKKVKKMDTFLEQINKLIYPQLIEEMERVSKSNKNFKNIDGSVSDPANELLEYAIDLKNDRDLDEIVEELYHRHRKDSVVEEEGFKFTIFALSYFVPKGVEVFKRYNKRANINDNEVIKDRIAKMEAKSKVFEAELELERVKQEVHEASKRD